MENSSLYALSLFSIQEPTSGLDSSSALNLMETLRRLAVDENKMIITSIHQPSSQLFHLSDDLLLMAKGKVTTYFCMIPRKENLAVLYLYSQCKIIIF